MHIYYLTIINKRLIHHLKPYIEKIKARVPINYTAFQDACNKVGISTNLFRDIFSVTRDGKLKKGQYDVKVKDSELFDKYFARYLHESGDLKVTAALHGNSKTKKTNGAVLNFKHCLTDHHGISICFLNNETTFISSSKSLLIVENLNNFINPNGTITGLPSEFNNFNTIWGSGIDIASEQYTNFLSSYENIYCFFDYDLGGFKTYTSLYSKLSNTNISFYLSPKLTEYLELFGNPISEKQYLELLKYRNNSGLEKVIEIILSVKTSSNSPLFLEQETLQYYLENQHGK